MNVVGILFIAFGVWCAYCSVNSFKPIPLLLAIISAPTSAQSVVDAAKAQRDSSGYHGGSTGAGTAGGGGGGGGGSGVVDIQPFSGSYGPFSGYKVTDTFAAHIARHSSAPGIDFGMPVGTTLRAPVPGVVTFHPNINPLAGNQIQIKLANGDIMDMDHVSGFANIPSGSTVQAGQAVGFSGGAAGAPGSGDSTGPHVHVDVHTPGGHFFPFTDLLGHSSLA